jgi:hypothetical protein
MLPSSVRAGHRISSSYDRVHRGAIGSTTTIRSMNLTEERYLPGDEALLLR